MALAPVALVQGQGRRDAKPIFGEVALRLRGPVPLCVGVVWHQLLACGRTCYHLPALAGNSEVLERYHLMVTLALNAASSLVIEALGGLPREHAFGSVGVVRLVARLGHLVADGNQLAANFHKLGGAPQVSGTAEMMVGAGCHSHNRAAVHRCPYTVVRAKQTEAPGGGWRGEWNEGHSANKIMHCGGATKGSGG